MRKPSNTENTVVISHRDSTCSECGEELGQQAWITLQGQNKIHCLSCSGLDDHYFLPSGDLALTVRSKKHSTVWAIVVEWNRRRKRYERQGMLVEEAALEKATAECLADADKRQQQRLKAAERREVQDKAYIRDFAARVKALYPGCPKGREFVIARHACRKYSGRVGRSAAAKAFTPRAIRLAVKAHIRHHESNYDRLMDKGFSRRDARNQVAAKIDQVLLLWQQPPNNPKESETP